jgi:hypothetical protein
MRAGSCGVETIIEIWMKGRERVNGLLSCIPIQEKGKKIT